MLNKLIRLANSFYKTIFKKDKAKLKKYDKATRKASSEAELKQITRQAINEVKGKDPRTDALIRRFEDRAFKKKVSELPKFKSKASAIEQKTQRKVLAPKGKEKARFSSPGKIEQTKTNKARSSIERTANQRIKKDPILDKARSTVDRSARQGIKRDPKQIKEKLSKSKSDNARSIVEKAGQTFTKKGEKARVEKLIKSKEFNKLKQEYKNTKDPVKKSSLARKIKGAAIVLGLGAGAYTFLASDPKVKPKTTTTKSKKSTRQSSNNNAKSSSGRAKINQTQSSVTRTDYDPNRRKNKLAAEAKKRALELARRKAAKKKRLESKTKSSKSSKYDKYDYYDPSFLGIRSRLKKK